MTITLRSLMIAMMGAFLLTVGWAVMLPTRMEVHADVFDGIEQFGNELVSTFDQLCGNTVKHGTLCGYSKALEDIHAKIDNVVVPNVGSSGQQRTSKYYLTTRLIACMVSPIAGDGAPGKPGYIIYYGTKMVDAISTRFMEILSAMALLATVIYGIRVALGHGHELQSGGFMLIFKVALLFLALGMVPQLYAASINTMNEAAGSIAAAIPTDICAHIDQAKASFKTADGDRTFLLPWVKLDCAVESIATIILDSKNSMVGVMVTAFLSGSMGKGLALAFFGMLVVLFSVINLAVFVVVLANLALVLMFMVAPMCWVCLMFKATGKYFHKWLTMTVGFILQPILLALFLMMMVSAYEQVICKQQFSVVASFNALKNDRIVVSYISNPPSAYSDARLHDDYGPEWCTPQKIAEATKNLVSMQGYEAYKTTVIKPTTDFDFAGFEIANEQGIFGKVLQVGKDMLGTIFNSEGFNMSKVDIPTLDPKFVGRLGVPFLSMLAAFTIMFILYAFLQQLPSFINQLASSAIASGNLNQVRMKPRSKDALSALENATSGMNVGGMGMFSGVREGLSGMRKGGN